MYRNLLTSSYIPDTGGQGRIKMASASILSTSKPAKDIILVHTVQLKPMIKAQIPGRMVSSGISDVVYSEKTCLKKLMMIMIIITSNRNHLLLFFFIS